MFKVNVNFFISANLFISAQAKANAVLAGAEINTLTLTLTY